MIFRLNLYCIYIKIYLYDKYDKSNDLLDYFLDLSTKMMEFNK